MILFWGKFISHMKKGLDIFFSSDLRVWNPDIRVWGVSKLWGFKAKDHMYHVGMFQEIFCAVKSSKKKTIRPSWYESWKDENFRLLFFCFFFLFWFDKETHQKCFSELDLDVCKRHIWMFWGPKPKDQDDGHKSVGSNHGCLVQRNQGGASSLESLLECCGGGSIFLFSRKTARTNSTITRWRISVLHLDSRILIKSIADGTVIWDEVVGQQNTGKCVGKTGKSEQKVTFWKFHCLKSASLFSFH